jgi:hypothetical protein
MRQKAHHWLADFLEPSLPWIRFCAVLIPALLLTGAEFKILAKAVKDNAHEERAMDNLEAANSQQAVEISKAQANLLLLAREADSVLGGILREDQETPDLRALEKLCVQPVGVPLADDVVRVMVSAVDQEYHAFVPALNRQETNSPLMRCTWLSLKTTGKPFHTSALPLQVDLELAFPKVSSRPPANLHKPGAK